jgi:hypothetical protein
MAADLPEHYEKYDDAFQFILFYKITNYG